MRKTTHAKILKGSEVKVEGKFTLDVMQIEQELPNKTSTELVEPQVRILQSESEFSVIEITCSCGETMHLRCEYTAAKTQEVPQQKVEPEEKSQEITEEEKKDEQEATNQEETEGEKNDVE